MPFEFTRSRTLIPQMVHFYVRKSRYGTNSNESEGVRIVEKRSWKDREVGKILVGKNSVGKDRTKLERFTVSWKDFFKLERFTLSWKDFFKLESFHRSWKDNNKTIGV